MSEGRRSLDHGSLNLPLGHKGRGGSLNRQIDRAAKEARKSQRERDRETFRSVRAKQDRVRQLLSDLTDERAIVLARPLGAIKAPTARLKLYAAAKSNLDRWIRALEMDYMRCETCAYWQQYLPDAGKCWCVERIEDYRNGPADITYPHARCEGWRCGLFEEDWLRSMGGDPNADWSLPEAPA